MDNKNKSHVLGLGKVNDDDDNDDDDDDNNNNKYQCLEQKIKWIIHTMEAVHRRIQLRLPIHTRITYLMQSTRDVSGLVDISVYPRNSLLDCRERYGQHVTVRNMLLRGTNWTTSYYKSITDLCKLHYHHGNMCLWMWPHYTAVIWRLCLFSKWLCNCSCL